MLLAKTTQDMTVKTIKPDLTFWASDLSDWQVDFQRNLHNGHVDQKFKKRIIDRASNLE